LKKWNKTSLPGRKINRRAKFKGRLMFNDLAREIADLAHKQAAKSPAWQRAAGKNEEGGLNAKGRASYNKATGGNLKAPVTESNPKGTRAKRQNSFCARMCGMKRVNTGGKTKKDPDSRINKSLRKWNCKCGSEEEKKALLLPAWGGHNYSAAPKGTGIGVEAGADYLLGLLPVPYAGIDIGTPHTGLRLGGPLPHIGIRSGVYTRPPGLNSSPSDSNSLWGLIAQQNKSEEEIKAEGDVNTYSRFKNISPEDIARDLQTFDQWKHMPQEKLTEVGKQLHKNLADAQKKLEDVREKRRQQEQKKDTEEKQAAVFPGLIGAFAGAAGGGLTGKKNKVNRAIGRGALIGAATELGMYPGMALGTIPGFLLGNALAGPGGGVPGAVIGGGLGTAAGGMLGNAAAKGLLGPYETPEELEEEKETKEEEKMGNAFNFGRKLAEVTTCSAPKHNEQSGVDVNPVAAGTPEGKEKLTKKKLPIKAEDVVGKKANSLVNFVERKPKDQKSIPNGGNLNPESAAEDHDEPEHEEDSSDAYDFGKKMAQVSDPVEASYAQEDAQRNVKTMLNNANLGRKTRFVTPEANVALNVGPGMVRSVGGLLGIPGAGFAGTAGEAFNVATTIGAAEQSGRYSRWARQRAEEHNKKFPTHPVTVPARPVRPKPTAKPTATPEVTPSAEGGYGNMPYYIAGGLGATGLAALAYYLSQRPKKKKREEDDGLIV
jgi:hypothetical protein